MDEAARGGPSLAPAEIRALRGALSRVEFAEQLGVTPLTVYRWELPAAAAQARRPRGRAAARLAELAARARPAASVAGAPATEAGDALEDLAAGERAALLPLLERVSAGETGRVEGELLALLASGRLLTFAARAMTAQAVARLALLARADVCGAFATLAPLLPELPRLTASVQLEVELTAALVFTWPDGRFFDAGRANTYLARAEQRLPTLGTPEHRALLLMARFTAAILLEEPAQVGEVLARLAELAPALTAPIHATLAMEARAHAAAQAGCSTVAANLFEQVLAASPLALPRVRALGGLAAIASEDGRAPREALALVERARELERRERLQPGQHDLVLADIAGAALARLGRVDDAARTLAEAIELAGELAWTPGWPAANLAPTLVRAGKADELRALAARLIDYQGVLAQAATRLTGRMLATLAALIGEPPGTVGLTARVDELEGQAAELEATVTWTNLRGAMLLLAATVTVHAGTAGQGEAAVARAERHFGGAPSIWAGALLRRLRAVLLARRGELHEARQLLESAIATLTLADDLGGATEARLLRARIGAALGEAGAGEEAARHRHALVQLGHAFGLDDLVGLPAAAAAPAATAAAGGLDALVVPIQRLAARGLSPELIRRELVAVAADALGDGAAVVLEDVDGGAPLARVGPVEGAPREWVELAAGGRRLRLGAAGAGDGGAAKGTLAALAAVAELALELSALRGVVGRPPSAPVRGEPPELPGFISVSAPMRQLKAALVRLSRSRATVIITGESGVGKEVVARAIHDLSPRAGKPFVAFNCAAVPRELFEGQLFGYRRGAFTGATTDQPGVLRAAAGGTVLLDEIGELPLDLQPKMLRFLESGEVLPLGERKPVTIDVRVIAATLRDLEQLVRDRRFREDLFYRLQVVPLRVPPLRERPEDVIALARHFVRVLAPPGRDPPVLGPDAVAALHPHRWPGNVRELRNVIERSLAFEPLPAVLGAEHLRIER